MHTALIQIFASTQDLFSSSQCRKIFSTTLKFYSLSTMNELYSVSVFFAMSTKHRRGLRNVPLVPNLYTRISETLNYRGSSSESVKSSQNCKRVMHGLPATLYYNYSPAAMLFVSWTPKQHYINDKKQNKFMRNLWFTFLVSWASSDQEERILLPMVLLHDNKTKVIIIRLNTHTHQVQHKSFHHFFLSSYKKHNQNQNQNAATTTTTTTTEQQQQI